MNNRWKKDIIENDMIEKELEEFRNYEENEQRDFENNVYYNTEIPDDFIYEKNTGDGIIDIINGMDTSNVSLKYGCRKISEYFREFYFDARTMNFITDIYLEVVMPESSLDLSEKQKYALFVTFVTFGTKNNTIEFNTVLSCIFNQICSGRNIKQNNNIIQIPIFNFDTLRTGFHLGLPVDTYDNHQHIINLTFYNGHEYLKDFEFSIIVNGIIANNTIRNQSGKDIKNNNKFLILAGQWSHWKVSELFYGKLVSNYRIMSGKSSIVKCISFCHIPNFQYDEPEINSVSLISDKKEIIRFDINELLDFNIFGVKIYCMPLCKEFSDWNEIYRLFKNNHISSDGLDFSKLGENIELQINFDKPSQMDDILIYCGIGFRECVIDNYMFKIK
jgi:hypothetical protein